MEKPIKIDDLGGKPTISGNIHIAHLISSIRIREKTPFERCVLGQPRCQDVQVWNSAEISRGSAVKKERVPGKHAPMEIIERFFGSKHLM